MKGSTIKRYRSTYNTLSTQDLWKGHYSLVPNILIINYMGKFAIWITFGVQSTGDMSQCENKPAKPRALGRGIAVGYYPLFSLSCGTVTVSPKSFTHLTFLERQRNFRDMVHLKDTCGFSSSQDWKISASSQPQNDLLLRSLALREQRVAWAPPVLYLWNPW